MSLEDFETLAKLGEGTYSSVYKVKRVTDSGVYALKKVRMTGLSSKEKENAINEVRILASLDNPNIIAYKQAFVDDQSQSLWYSLHPNVASSWNLQIMATSSRKSPNTKRTPLASSKTKSGTSSSKSSAAFAPSTTSKSSIGI